MQILIIIILIFISFLPIVFWGYIFSYIDNSVLNRKRFIFGIIAGIISVFPILYMEKINNLIDIKYLNLSYIISNTFDKDSFLSLVLSFLIFLFIFIIISIFLGFFTNKFFNIIKIYIKSITIFILLILILVSGFLFLNFIFLNFPILDFEISNNIYFGGMLLNTFKLIIFYYLIVAFLEETSKYFNFLGSGFSSIISTKKGVLYAIFVALGFSFIENILYLYHSYIELGFSFDLVKIYIYRGIFSVIVHVFCSSILALGVFKAISITKRDKLSLAYIKLFSLGVIFSILFHGIFDISLTLGFSFIILFYLIGGYLYVSSIFYKK